MSEDEKKAAVAAVFRNLKFTPSLGDLTEGQVKGKLEVCGEPVFEGTLHAFGLAKGLAKLTKTGKDDAAVAQVVSVAKNLFSFYHPQGGSPSESQSSEGGAPEAAQV